jgi:hypothetical protein
MQAAVAAKPKRPGPLASLAVFILWLSLACAGIAARWLYGTAPGKAGGTVLLAGMSGFGCPLFW